MSAIKTEYLPKVVKVKTNRMNQKPKIDVYSLLRSKYPASEYCLMEEVSDAAGFSRSRSADYIVYNLWPSRGLSVTGIELKRSRSDWQSEMRKPEKAENIFKYCDFFFLLTTDDTIAKIEEIPAAWGWMCVKGNGIRIIKDAPKQNPEALSRGFIACMLKRAANKEKFVHIDSIQDRIDEAASNAKAQETRELEHITQELIEIQARHREFEASSGIQMGRWTKPEKIGEAVRIISSGEYKHIEKKLLDMQNTAEVVLSQLTAALEAFKLISSGTAGEKMHAIIQDPINLQIKN